MREKMGRQEFNHMCSSKPKTWQKARETFEEHIKRVFDPERPIDFFISVGNCQDNEEAGIEDGFITLPSKDVAEMFRPAEEKIVELIDGQLRGISASGKRAVAILLVGGFGSSPYLYKVVKRHFEEKWNTILQAQDQHTLADGQKRRFEVRQPPHPWSAVVRGAAIRGCQNDVVLSRKSRRHYGVTASETFSPYRHPQDCKFWDDADRQYKARNRMTWYIRKGSNVSSAVPIKFNFYRQFGPTDSLAVADELVVCDEDDAPDGYSNHPGSPTRALCTVRTNLNTVPAHLWKSKTGASGRSYREIGYEIGLQMVSGGLKFELTVDGRPYGSVTASFD
jgi:hypothetical protein